MVNTQVATEARAGSKRCAFCHSVAMTSCAHSSASVAEAPDEVSRTGAEGRAQEPRAALHQTDVVGPVAVPVPHGAEEVRVGLGELLFVELVANRQVVRIDEDLELAVKDIALLDAKKSSQSAAQQLDALLTPAERSHFNDIRGN